MNVGSRKQAWAILLGIILSSTGGWAAGFKTQNVFLIISDGFRWQAVFSGAEADLMTRANGGVIDTNALRAQFWRETPEARRAALLPFFRNRIASQGQIFGNQSKGSVVSVTNDKNFSYPGYNEILWTMVQVMPVYRDKTTIIVTADHGRGSGPSDWKSHGEKVAGSEADWIAVIGPDTPALGERMQTEAHTQSQIAATIAALLGQDYHTAFPQTGLPISDIVAGVKRSSIPNKP